MTINNNNIFGAFTLNEARGSRLTGDWLNKESVANYGWFGGGLVPGLPVPRTSVVDRIDFSNDTASASPRGPLTVGRNGLAATGNSNYGWFGGGVVNPPTISTVDRIDFSNDGATASVRGPLNTSRTDFAAIGNSNYGWFGGGNAPGVSRVERIDFSNDSATASPRSPLSVERYALTSSGNSNYGWFGGGINFAFTPGLLSTVDRIDFSNDFATSNVRGPLSSGRGYLAATGNSNYGWFSGGTTVSPRVTTVERIDFSNDSTAASIRGPLSLDRHSLAASGNSNYGWFGGGSGPLSNDISRVDRIDFSNDSLTASIRGLLSTGGTRWQAATSGVLNIRRQKAGNYGWFGGSGGGPAVPSPIYSIVDRIDFSNDTPSTIARGPLSSARYRGAATGNSNYGWFGGGLVPSVPAYAPTDRVDRIDFSNDSPAALVRSPLSGVRYGMAATGNSNYGWFGGGNAFFIPTPYYSIVDRINFSNDLTTISQRNPLLQSRFNLAATENSNYGWFGGGFTPGVPTDDRVDRIDFANDSATSSIRGPLFQGRQYLAATGNSNYGWFGGGFAPSVPGSVSTVNRIDFSNDSSTTSPRGPLTLERYILEATGNSNYGWFGGGVNPSIPILKSTVDRINFSNDSVSASLRGPFISPTRSGQAATSNTTR